MNVCKECGKPVGKSAVACPNCGGLTGRGRNDRNAEMISAVVVAGFVVFLLLLVFGVFG